MTLMLVRFLMCSACVLVLACGDGSDDGPSSTQSVTSTTGTGTGGAAGTGGSASVGGGGGSAPGGGYRAFGYSGGLEHLTVVKFDDERDVCVRIFLAAPEQMSAVPITVPAEWGIVVAEMGQGSADCTSVPQLMSSYQPDGGSGSIAWTASCPTCIPTELDIHATLTFPAGPEWLPASEPLDADGIPVERWQ